MECRCVGGYMLYRHRHRLNSTIRFIQIIVRSSILMAMRLLLNQKLIEIVNLIATSTTYSMTLSHFRLQCRCTVVGHTIRLKNYETVVNAKCIEVSTEWKRSSLILFSALFSFLFIHILLSSLIQTPLSLILSWRLISFDFWPHFSIEELEIEKKPLTRSEDSLNER